MGTRSDIIVHCANGKWKRIYCHWDGNLSHNGKILFEHYTSLEQAEALVALGDLSVLGPRLGVKHPFEGPSRYLPHSDKPNPAFAKYEAKYDGMCLAYTRDRGETGADGTIGDTLQAVWPPEDTWTEFTYVWDDGRWWCTDPDEGTQTLIDLGDLLSGKRTLRPSVKAFGMVLGRHAAHDPAKPDDHTWSARRKGLNKVMGSK